MSDNKATEAETVVVDMDLQDLMPGFMENRKTDIIVLQENLSGGNYNKIKDIGHTLKGSGGGYGFDEITRIGADIEKYADKADEDRLKILIKELKDYIEKVVVVFE